ncbi:hypothetical protein AVEN_164110-1 [Araneus ventricosus]|uniref:Uncharacterized protein n=1 Tax=Araneus ventricosus TaxID=182803 RepID=A0A4Y2NSH5_ARAVE|nr:hypothetical protein AVEN_164110-1 [Araneus ventricosus]
MIYIHDDKTCTKFYPSFSWSSSFEHWSQGERDSRRTDFPRRILFKIDRNPYKLCVKTTYQIYYLALISFLGLSCSQTDAASTPDKRCQQQAVFPGGQPPSQVLRPRLMPLTAMTRMRTGVCACSMAVGCIQTARHAKFQLRFRTPEVYTGDSSKSRVRIYADDYNTFSCILVYESKDQYFPVNLFSAIRPYVKAFMLLFKVSHDKGMTKKAIPQEPFAQAKC